MSLLAPGANYGISAPRRCKIGELGLFRSQKPFDGCSGLVIERCFEDLLVMPNIQLGYLARTSEFVGHAAFPTGNMLH